MPVLAPWQCLCLASRVSERHHLTGDPHPRQHGTETRSRLWLDQVIPATPPDSLPCRGQPDPAAVASLWPPEERERLIAEFSRAPQSRDLTSAVARFLPRDLHRGRLRPGYRTSSLTADFEQTVKTARSPGADRVIVLSSVFLYRGSLPARLRRAPRRIDPRSDEEQH